MAGISFLGSVNPCFSSGTPFHPTSHKRDCGKMFVRPSVRESRFKRDLFPCAAGREIGQAHFSETDGRTDSRHFIGDEHERERTMQR